MEAILQYNAEKLGRLLQLWMDCPTQVRSTLSPGIAQFSELCNDAAKYEEVRYPFLFFQHLSDAAVLTLEGREALDEGSTSLLLMAWTSVQLSIYLTNDPSLFEKLNLALVGALQNTSDLLATFIKYRAEQKDKPEEWKLALDIQTLSCDGTFATLQMLHKLRTKESLILKLQDLDKETQSLAKKVTHLRQAARSEKAS